MGELGDRLSDPLASRAARETFSKKGYGEWSEFALASLLATLPTGTAHDRELLALVQGALEQKRKQREVRDLLARGYHDR